MSAVLPNLLFVIWLGLFAVKGLAFVDCAVRRSDDFQRAQTLQKPAWLGILALALLADAFVSGGNPIGIFALAGTVAALVYLAQLRGSQY